MHRSRPTGSSGSAATTATRQPRRQRGRDQYRRHQFRIQDCPRVDRIQQAWLRERPDLPVDSIGVITRIWRIAKILGDDRRRTMARLGADPATRDLLATLRRAGPPYQMTAGDIAKQTLVSAGAVPQRVVRAERDGLVQRSRSGLDGRGVIVGLTDAGHALVEGTVADLLRHENDLLSGLTPAQRHQLADLLRLLLADLTDRFSVDDRP